MFSFRAFLSIVCLTSAATFAADPPKIKKVLAPYTSPASGPEMFKEYCASCHGIDAKGRGPAVAALRVAPPDLTLLSQKRNGKFPDVQVYTAIRGDVNLTAHGSPDMPIWGNVFREMARVGDNERETAMRMRALCAYIESLQQK